MSKDDALSGNQPIHRYKNFIKRLILQSGLLKFVTTSKHLEFLFKPPRRKLANIYKTESGLKLHLGCGRQILPGWINIDWLWRPHVLVMKLPSGLKFFKDNSVEFIYACHFLEHLEYPNEVAALLKKCHRLLKSGGVLRIGVPDIELIIAAYAADDETFFRVQSKLHPPWCTTKLDHLLYALQQDGEHKYGYDFETIKRALFNAGFNRVLRRNFGQSDYEALRVDYRTDDQTNDHLTLYVDAVKQS